MSAHDDYPTLIGITSYDPELKRELAHVLDEIDRLRAWKAEAMVVLAEWDEVWEAAGRPGPLGASKAANVRKFLLDNDRER